MRLTALNFTALRPCPTTAARRVSPCAFARPLNRHRSPAASSPHLPRPHHQRLPLYLRLPPRPPLLFPPAPTPPVFLPPLILPQNPTPSPAKTTTRTIHRMDATACPLPIPLLSCGQNSVRFSCAHPTLSCGSPPPSSSTPTRDSMHMPTRPRLLAPPTTHLLLFYSRVRP